MSRHLSTNQFLGKEDERDIFEGAMSIQTEENLFDQLTFDGKSFRLPFPIDDHPRISTSLQLFLLPWQVSALLFPASKREGTALTQRTRTRRRWRA